MALSDWQLLESLSRMPFIDAAELADILDLVLTLTADVDEFVEEIARLERGL